MPLRSCAPAHPAEGLRSGGVNREIDAPDCRCHCATGNRAAFMSAPAPLKSSRLRLTHEDAQKFFATLDHPPAPGRALRKAAAASRRLIRE